MLLLIQQTRERETDFPSSPSLPSSSSAVKDDHKTKGRTNTRKKEVSRGKKGWTFGSFRSKTLDQIVDQDEGSTDLRELS